MWTKIRFKDPFMFDKPISEIICEIRKQYGYDLVDYIGVRATGKMHTSSRTAYINTKITSLVLLEYGKYIERVNEHNT